jgi:hypothetical protein
MMALWESRIGAKCHQPGSRHWPRWGAHAERRFVLQVTATLFRSISVFVPVHLTSLPPSNNGTASDLNQ